MLLLNELTRCELDSDVAPIKDAVSAMSIAASVINEAIRDRENCEKMSEVQARFTSDSENLFLPTRYLIREGDLLKLDRRNNSLQYTFFLFNDILIYAESTALGLKLHRIMNLDTLSLSTPSKTDEEIVGYDHSNAFCILSSQKSFIVVADDEITKRLWMNDIEKALRQYIDDNDENVKSAAAPVWNADSTANCCVLCATNFTLFNRYLFLISYISNAQPTPL